METLNTNLFLLLNAPAAADASTVLVAICAAQGLVYLGAALAAGLWIWGTPAKRGTLLSTGVGLLAASAISLLITLLWYHPRPFVVGIGRSLMAHSPETSFPSDHATFLWTLGLAFAVTGAWRAWGWLLIAMGVATAWARICLGVHFPLDMAGSFAVAAVSAAIVGAIHPLVERRLLPPLDRFYESVLGTLRLPLRVFPRRTSD
jgi:undecaprenyl-diphosphatase